MKILILSKSFYTGKDMLRDRYGRVYEFARVLASLGHRVYGVVLDYHQSRGDAGETVLHNANLSWDTARLCPKPLAGFRAYLKKINAAVCKYAPDTVLSVSDVFHVVLGDWLTTQHGLPHVVDLYDNYESFAAARLPGAVSLFRRALKRADGIVCVSQPLAAYVQAGCRLRTAPRVITNAVDTQRFSPRNRIACRRRFHLPEGKILVGYGGALARNRGISVVFQAHRELSEADPDIHLVLAGPVDKYTKIPINKNVHYLGDLGYTAMPEFFGALDVGIVSNRDSAFGRYCFPQKFFEMLACNIAVVTASTGEMTELMKECLHAVFRPENSKELVRAIRRQLDTPCRPSIEIPSWDRQGAALSDYLEAVAG